MGIWFDASAIEGVADGGAISSWLDISGNGRHMNNVYDDPVLRTSESTLNNKPVVDFKDENDRMWTSYNFRDGAEVGKWRAEGYTAIGISRYSGNVNSGQSERVIASNGGNWLFGHDGQITNRFHFDGWIDDGDNVRDTNWRLYIAKHQGKDTAGDPACIIYDTGEERADNQPATGSNNDWFMPQQLEFGAMNNNGSNSVCQIAEYMMYYGELADGDRQLLEGYLTAKYGLTLPDGHPYKGAGNPLDSEVEIGGENATVKLYWGDDNGTANGNVWDNTVTVSGTHPRGTVGTDITGLTNGATYYFRAFASNGAGDVWASDTNSFKATNTLLNKDTVPGLVFWVAADDVDGNGVADSLADGALVHEWKDKSDSGLLAKQLSSSSARPSYQTQEFGKRASIRFDGVNDNLFLDAAVRDSLGGVSTFVVSKRIEKQDGGAATRILGTSEFDVLSGVEEAFEARIDTYSAAENKIINVKIGREDATASEYFSGDVAEVLIFNRALTTLETLMVQGYLAHKWSATDSLLASHPYKGVAPSFDNSPILSMVQGVDGFDAPSRDGLLGEWLFDDGNLNDTSGNDYHGATNGAAYVTETNSGTGKAINLNGNKYVNVDDGQGQTVFGGGTKFSISAWVKEEPDGDWEPWISKRGEGGRGWQLRKRVANEITFTTHGPGGGDGNFRKTATGPVVNDNEWHHLVAVHGHDGGKQRIYLDGALFHEQTHSGYINATGSQLVFGARDNSDNAGNAINIGNHSNTYLDDIRYYNRALTENEVAVMGGALLNKIEGNFANAFDYQVQAVRGPDTFSVTAGALPDGLTMDAAGKITGNPSKTGDFNATIKVLNSSGFNEKVYFFRIHRGTQSITFTPDFGNKTYGDANMTLSSTSSAVGRSPVFRSSNSTIASISGNPVLVPTVDSGLIAHFRFETGSGTTAKNDFGLDGTLNNMVAADWVDAKFGKGLDFDGSNDYVEVDKSVGELKNITVSFWVKPTQMAWDQIISKVASGGSGKGWAFRVSSAGELRMRAGSSGSTSEVTSPVAKYAQGVWTHMVGTFDSNTRYAKVYANGTQVASETLSSGRTSLEGDTVLRFGVPLNQNTNDKYTGILDDVRIYDNVLDPADVASIYGDGDGDWVTYYDGNKLAFNKAGQVNIIAFGAADADVASGAAVSRPLIIAKPEITITADDKSRKVNEANPAFTYVATGFVSGETASVITTAPTLTPKDGSGATIADNSNVAGSYTIVPSAAVAENYVFKYVNGDFIIDARTAQTITWSQDLSSVSFGDTVALTATSSSNLPVTYEIETETIASLVVTRDYHLDAWWRLDETTGTTGSDNSGNSHPLLLVGGPTWKVGKFRNGLYFDGINDYAQAFSYKGVTGTAKRTYSFWLQTNTANRGILSSGASSGAGCFALTLDGSGKLKVDYGNGSLLSTIAVTDDVGHQVVVTLLKEGKVNETKIWIDGADKTGTATNGTNAVTTNATQDVILGKVGVSYFKGTLDDVRVYVGDLKEETDNMEITAIYSGGFGDFNKIRIIGTGTTKITADQPGDLAYAPALDIEKTITVSKQNQSITFTPMPNKSVGDFDFDAGATASSTLPISYASSDTNIAQIIGPDNDGDFSPDPGTQKIRIRAAGTVTITASQAGDSIYNAATNLQQTLTINFYNLFPDSITGMEFWFDGNNVNADTSVDVIVDNSAFFTWNDMSGNTRNAVQGDAAKMGIYKLNSLNSKGTIQFDAADTLDLPSTSGIKMVFAVIKQDSGQSAVTKPFGGDLEATTSGGKVGLKRTGAATGMIDSGISSQAFNVVVWQADAGSYALYVNGGDQGQGTEAQAISALDKIANDMKGSIAEVVGYDRVLPSLARLKIEAYLAHKWGLQGLLPADHKYKSDLPTFGGAQEVVFQPLGDKTPESAPFQLLAESSSGLPLTFESNNTSLATVSGNTVTVIAKGLVGIKSIQAGDGNWWPADTTQTLNITDAPRKDQHIVFAAIPDKTVLTANFDLNATSLRSDNNETTGLTVAFISTNTAVATVAGKTITIKGQGTTTLRASQAGDNQFNPASFAEQELKVTKVGQTITFAAIPSKKLSDGTFSLTASSDSGLPITFNSSNSTMASVAGNVVTLNAGGTVSIAATQAGDVTYDAASAVSQTLTIQDDSLQEQTITWTQDLSGKRFGDADITLNATATSTGPVTYASSDTAVATIVGGNKLRITGAGSATINASQVGGSIGGDEWQAASLSKSMTIAKSTQNIVSANNGSNLLNLVMSAGDFDFDPGAKSIDAVSSVATGLPVTYASSNTSVALIIGGGSKVRIAGPGSVTITASSASTSGYDAATDKTFTITVNEYNMYADSVAGLLSWLDGTDVNADGQSETSSDFTQVGGVAKVSLWGDRSGKGNNLTQSNTANMPIYLPSLGNAVLKPFVAFGPTLTSTSSTHLLGSLPATITGSPSITVLVAAMSGNDSASKLVHFGATAGTAGQVMGLAQDSSFNYNNGKLAFGGNFMDAKTVGAFRRSSPTTHADGDFFRNGAAVSGTVTNGSNTLNIPSTGNREILVGSGRGTNGALNDFFDGAILEVIIFDVALDDWNIRRLEGYLAHKWGMPGSLPSNHAFRNQPPTFGGTQTITLAFEDLSVDSESGLSQISDLADAFYPKGSHASSGLPLTLTSSNSAIAAIVNGRINPVSVGTVTITATQAGDSHFSAATTVTKQLKVITKPPQTITFTDPGELGQGLSANLVATSDSNLTVTLAITAGADKATLNGTTLTGTALGNVTIQATQAGNNDYLAATPVSRTIAVKKGLNLVFDAIGTMGKNQVIPLRAKVFNKRTNKVMPVPITFTVVSGPSGTVITGGDKITCGNAEGAVVVKATTTDPSGAFSEFAMTSKSLSFAINDMQGQMIVFKQGESGGLRDLPFSRKPIHIGMMVTSMASATTPTNIAVSLSIVGGASNFVEVVGSGVNQRLMFKKGATPTKVGGKMQPIAIQLKATAAGNANFNAAAPVIKDLNILPPGKDAFFNDRMMDERYSSVRNDFARKLLARKDLGKISDLDGDGDTDLDDAKAMFDSDEADSDGDGKSNLLERAFGSDSLGPDTKRNMPRRMPSKAGKQRISFVQYQSDFNEEGIEYIVERSTDLRTWTTSGVSVMASETNDIGGGMERVVWQSDAKVVDGSRQYLRLRIRTK